MTTNILSNHPEHGAVAHLILAHGAGAPMDSDYLDKVVNGLISRNIALSRFEFAYMADRRNPNGKKRPPPRVDKLTIEYNAVVDQVRKSLPDEIPLLIGGKSMGARVASMIADHQFHLNSISGLVCLGYPFHPVNKPESLRTEHLKRLKCPSLIVQGDRDKLGSYEDVSGYSLSPNISLAWLTDGDHDFKPRKASGTTLENNIAVAAEAISSFTTGLDQH